MFGDKYLSSKTIVAALERLADSGIGRTRSTLMGYLILKAKEPMQGVEFEVQSSGAQSTKAEVDRFMLLAPEADTPLVNPFGRHEGRPEWARPGYERRNVYTGLYRTRHLERFMPVQTKNGGFTVSLPTDVAEKLANELGNKVPLEPTAAFFMRGESFVADATPENVVQRFQESFHLTDTESDALFQPDPEFEIAFADELFDGGLAALPSDLHPLSPAEAQAGAARAVQRHVALAATGDEELLFEEQLLRRARRALVRSKAIALVGPPGTGKSRLAEQLVHEARADPATFGLEKEPQFDRYTAEVDWTARTIVGGYFPQEGGRLVFQEGHLLRAISQDHWLILDEMNRADLDRVLGPILTLLTGQRVDLGLTELSPDGVPMFLAWGNNHKSGVLREDQQEDTEGSRQRVYLVGRDWRLLGTYNSVDLGRVFSMGAALSRRWATIPVPPLSAASITTVLKRAAPSLSYELVEQIRQLYTVHLNALPLGPAPFVEIARYVVDEPSPLLGGEIAGAADPLLADNQSNAMDLLADAYIMYIGPQLRRLSGDTRTSFFDELATILGEDVVAELRATF